MPLIATRFTTTEIIKRIIRLICLGYYHITICFRLAFRANLNIYKHFSAGLFFDYLVDFFFILDALNFFYKNKVTPLSHAPCHSLSKQVKGKLSIPRGKQYSNIYCSVWSFNFALHFMMMFPLEIIGYLAGAPNFQWLRVFRLLRFVYYFTYCDQIREILEEYKIIRSVGLQRFVFIFLTTAVVGHTSACIFYSISLDTLKTNNERTWIFRDRLAVYAGNQTVKFLKPLSFRYLRSIYWAIQTIASTAFGDVSAFSEHETWYCIFYFYITGAFVYTTVANMMMLITNMDSARTKNLLKVAKFDKYAAYRKLPPELTKRVKSYFNYQWQLLKGVDENQILSELPPNITQQILQSVVRDFLMEVSVLQDLNKALLNALSERVESYIYSPLDVIIETDSVVSGVYVVSSGEVEVSHSGVTLNEALHSKDCFGVRALYKSYTSADQYWAKSFSEVLLVRGTVFRHLCRMYLSPSELETIMDKVQQINQEHLIQVQSRRVSALSRNDSRVTDPHKPSVQLQRPTMFKAISMKVILGEDEKAQNSFFYPDGPFRILWDCGIFLWLVFYMITLGLLLAGTMHQDYLEHYRGLLIANYVADVIFFADMVLKAFVFNYVEDGKIITKTEEIFQHFLKEKYVALWFMSIFPFDVIFGYSIDYRLIPILRLLKLLHVRNFQFYYTNFEDSLRIYLNWSISFEMSRFITLYWALFQVCHWAACFWQLTADVGVQILGYDISWRISDANSDFFSVDYSALSGTAFYWRSIYWAVNVLSAVGFADMTAKNPLEMIVVSIIMFFGVSLFNTLLGAIASLIGSFGREEREFNSKVDKIRQLMKIRDIPVEIETKILRYYEYVWTRYSGVNEKEVLDSLPKSLRSAVANYVMGPLLSKIPFFACCSEPMEQMIVSLFRSRVFLHDDALMTCGELGKEMFIIEQGFVNVVSEDRKTNYATLTSGNYIGESCLLQATKRTATVLANGYVDTYYLTNDSFLKAAEKFPAEYGSIIEAVTQTLIQKQKINAALLTAATSSSSDDSTPERPIENQVVPAQDHSNNKTVAPLTPEVNTNNTGYALLVSDHNVTDTATADMSPIPSKEGESSIAIRPVEKTLDPASGEIVFLNKRSSGRGSKIMRTPSAAVLNKECPDKIHPDTAFRLFWDVAIFFILVYFSVMIPLRIALILHPFLLYIDYAFDVINLVDCYLYSSMFAIFQGGQLLVKTNDIRWFYYQDRAIYDVISGFPYDLIVLGFLSYDIETILFIRAVLRLPKMLKFLLISRYFRQVERLMKILNVSFIIFRFLELTFSILIISHWTACVFYMFSNLGHLSDCVPEPDQYYAEACRFRGTWVEQQIATLKLPIDGGDQWTRLIRAFNWAIPTLTGESMGDCWVMNANEVLYAFLVMLFGLAINGVIIGSIMTLVSSASEETTKIYRKIELLRSYLTMKNVPADLIDSSISLLMHQASEEGLLTLSQDKIFSDLPHSIKISIDQYLKTVPFLRQCAFFDFCPDEVLRGISSKLKVCMYVAGDHIICCGDLGHDMFFLESGTVHVVSADGNTLYSTLEDGAFFGETALFFRSTRTATIKAASPICVCLQLTKGDLDHELRSLDYNDEEVLDSFRQLQITNQKRNAAVTTNLAASRDPNNKLFKLIHTADTTVVAVPILLRIRTFLCPDSAFRVVWDMLGLLFLMYYTFSIPFYIAFFFGEKVDLYLRFIAFDFLIDSYWVLDIIFKAFFFSFHINLTHTKLVTDGEAIFHKYYTSGNYYTDILASIPLEFFGLIPNTNRIMIFIFRMGHLLRFPQLVAYSNLVEYHLRAQLGINIARSTSLLTKAGVAYVILNHWLTCGYFMLHRYAERRNDLTFIIADKLATFNYETNEHDICSTRISFCYSRVIYFTVGIMAGIGYGDMSPYTSGEHVYQGMVAILGAYIAATVLGFVGAFLESLDANGNSPFKTKLREVEMYIDFRRLDPTLKDTILAQYTHTWNKNRSLGGMRNDVLNDLSTWKATELSLLLNADILKTVPMLRDATDQVRRHVALNLMPLIALANSNVYHAGDVGNSVFFVASGDINLTLSSDRSTLDSFGLVSLQILLKKQSGHGIAYLAGDHFGEFCLLSKSGLRAESARATIDSELYSLSKECIWDMFLYMTFHNRRRFVHQLMTRVGENDYIDSPLREFCEGGQVGDERIKFLFRLSYQVMKEIIEDMEVVSSAGESESDDSPDEDKDAQDSPAVRRASSGSVKLGRKSSSDGLASEHSFKQIKKILKEEQAVTISQRDKLYLFDDLNNSPSVLQHSSSKKTFSAPAMAMRINRQTSDHLPYDEAAEYHQSLRRNDSFHSTTSTDYSEFVSHNQFRINMSKFIVNASPSNKETSAEEPTTMPDVKRNSDPLPGAVMSVRFGSMESMGIPGDESIKSDKVEVDKQFSSNSIMSDLTVPTMLNLSPHQSPHASPHSSPIRIPVVSNLRKSALVNSSLATAGAKSLKKRRHSLGSFTPPPMIEEVKPWTEPKAPSDNGTIAVRRRSTSSAIEGNGIIDEESQKYAEEIELRITGHRTRSFNGSTLY